MNKMTTDFSNVIFKNPIVMASGTFGFGKEYGQIYDLSILGGVSVKGLTLKPRAGNKGVRSLETPSGMINSVGLENPGVENFLKEDIYYLDNIDTNIIANLGGGTLEEYIEGAKLIDSYQKSSNYKRGVSMIELNISCPNVKEGGMAFGIDTSVARTVVREVRKTTSLPLVVKLSPNAKDIVEMAVMCEEEGANGVSLVNTFNALQIDIRKKKSPLKNIYGGLSGPAIKPIALRMVNQVSKAIKIPIMGMGGVTSWEDAIEFIMAGSTIVQVGTWNFVDPLAGPKIVSGIEKYMDEEGIKSLDEIRGII